MISLTRAIALWTTVAALAAGLGPLLLARGRGARWPLLGWANASAAGLMLGGAYLLMTVGLERAPRLAVVGAALGIAATYAAHVARGTGLGEPLAVPSESPPEPSPAGRTGAVLTVAIHSAPEGVAIGAAAALDPRFGLFLATTLGVHNVSEGAVLGARLRAGGVSPGVAAALAVLAKSSQVVLALATYVAVRAAPGALPVTLGVAFGALVYLSMAELLPESYRQAGRTGIAVVAVIAAAVVGLLGGGTR